MENILDKYKKEILWEKPIEIYGLKLYPVKMIDAIDFYNCSGVVMIDSSELKDEQLIKLSYLELMYAFIESEKKVKEQTDKEIKFKDKFYQLLGMCLNINKDNITNDISFYVKRDKDKEKLILRIKQDNKIIELSKGMFDNFRKVLCEQNSIELPDLEINEQIRKNSEEMKKKSSTDDFDLMNLVYSICAVGKFELNNIENWSLFRFNKILEGIEKDKNYNLYKGAELGGMVSFKNGNPIKTWLLTKSKKDYGIMSLENMTKTFGINSTQTENAQNNTKEKPTKRKPKQ